MDIRYICHIILFIVLGIPLYGQSLDDAKSWYLEGRYADALPVFMAEYPENPKDAPLNQWLGVSLYETGRLTEAEPYLKYASERKIPEAYLYLGELYAKLYRFEEAEKEFEKHQRANRRNQEALDRLAQAREYADRLQRAVSRTEDVQIIDSLVVRKDAFLLAYNLSTSSGSLMPLNDFFRDQAAAGKTLYMNERKDKIYYSRDSEASGTSLFTMEKLIDEFGNEKELPASINTAGQQAYPFVMSDGLTLYFASTGHQAFGGYDLYVTRYNLATDSYLVPNQLNMPFNSPFNDYLMAIDEEKGVGWFASDRFQPEDSVCVYTFIPNERVTLVEGGEFENEEAEMKQMARRAMIASIAESWKGNTDYASVRTLARQKPVQEQQASGDFEFVINDQVTYYTLSDFRNDQARSIYSQVQGLKSQLHSMQDTLAEQRERFASGESSNSTLRASILQLEKEVPKLQEEVKRLEIQARNQEIRAQN